MGEKRKMETNKKVVMMSMVSLKGSPHEKLIRKLERLLVKLNENGITVQVTGWPGCRNTLSGVHRTSFRKGRR
jgi:hypothetical protein